MAGLGNSRAEGSAIDNEHEDEIEERVETILTAIDQGGCGETSRPTTRHDPVYVGEGITYYCVANMSAAYARTATRALTNVTARFVEYLAEGGVEGAIKKEPDFSSGINVMGGRIRNKTVAQSHRMPYEGF